MKSAYGWTLLYTQSVLCTQLHRTTRTKQQTKQQTTLPCTVTRKQQRAKAAMLATNPPSIKPTTGDDHNIKRNVFIFIRQVWGPLFPKLILHNFAYHQGGVHWRHYVSPSKNVVLVESQGLLTPAWWVHWANKINLNQQQPTNCRISEMVWLLSTKIGGLPTIPDQTTKVEVQSHPRCKSLTNCNDLLQVMSMGFYP